MYTFHTHTKQKVNLCILYVACRPVARQRPIKGTEERRSLCGPCRAVISRTVSEELSSFDRQSQSRVEAGSNTSTVDLQVVGGDEKGTRLLGA
jgi:hypothetical protein